MCIISGRQAKMSCVFCRVFRLLHGAQRQTADQKLFWRPLHLIEQLLDFLGIHLPARHP